MPPSVLLLSAFAGTAYLIWLVVFRIYRYAVPIELVASLLLVLALRTVLEGNKYRKTISAVVICTIIATTVLPDWGRTPLRPGRYIDVRISSLAPDALVLILSGEPFGYVLPFIASRPRSLRPVSNFTGPGYDNRFEREMASLIARHRGPMYVIRYLDVSDCGEEEALIFYGLKRVDAECQAVKSNLEGARRLGICPIIRKRS